MATTTTTQPYSRWDKWMPGLLAALLICQAAVALHFMGAVAGGADSSGYMNCARLLARGEFTEPIRFVEGVDAASLPGYIENLYEPLGYRPILNNQTLSPTYSVGLPLLISAAAQIANWELAPAAVMLLHALLATWITFSLGRECGLSRAWAALGAFILAASPLTGLMSQNTMSDMPALVWTSAGIVAALRARHQPSYACLAGLLLGFAVLIRPTNILVFLPATVALNWRPQLLVRLVLGASPAAVIFATCNLQSFGAILAFGYYNPPGIFSLKHLGPSLLHYAKWLPVLLTPLVLAAAGLPWTRTAGSNLKWVLGLWIALILGFYTIYSFTYFDWKFMRFLLPAFPPLLVAALLVIRDFQQRSIWRLTPAAQWLLTATLVTLNGLLWGYFLHIANAGRYEKLYPATAAWMRAHVPADAVVLAVQDSGSLHYYTDFRLLRADWFQPPQFQLAAHRILAAGRPIYAVLHDFERDDLFARCIPGRWENVERVSFNRTVWRLAAPSDTTGK